jgi:hypothetical protein
MLKKIHYLIASLQNAGKDLIRNLHITNENFLVSWQLVTQRCNNKRVNSNDACKKFVSDATSKEG